MAFLYPGDVVECHAMGWAYLIQVAQRIRRSVHVLEVHGSFPTKRNEVLFCPTGVAGQCPDWLGNAQSGGTVITGALSTYLKKQLGPYRRTRFVLEPTPPPCICNICDPTAYHPF
jgi:hypothetical protein